MEKTILWEDWVAEAARRFGPDKKQWAFVCPACGVVTKTHEWTDAGAPVGSVAFACIGRWLHDSRPAFGGKVEGPCNYSGGGLFALNPVKVEREGSTYSVFDFAPEVQSGV